MERTKLVWYLSLAFGISWSLALIFWLIRDTFESVSLPFMIMGIGFMFGPMVSVIITEKRFGSERITRLYPLQFKWNKWWTIAWLFPLVISLGSLLAGLLMPGTSLSLEMEGMFERFKDTLTPEQLEQMRNTPMPVHPFFITILQGLVAGITINAVAGFGEELGWRGLMYREFKTMTFWKASVIIGVVWGIWHAPMILMGHNYPQHPVVGVLMMTLFCILLAPLFNLVRWKSRSVLAAAIFHGSFNALSGLAIMLIKGGNDLLIGVTGLAGMVVLVLINLVIWLRYPETTRHTLEELDPSLRPVAVEPTDSAAMA